MSFDVIAIGVAAAAALALIAWFFIGAQWNVKRAHEALSWLRDGLPLLGERTTLRWMGTTGVHLEMSEAKTPFKSVGITLLMEPRDVAPLWALTYLRGRRDAMQLRGRLRRHARVELDIFLPKTRSAQPTRKQGLPQEWPQTALADGLIVASEGARATAAVQALLPILERLSPFVRRLTIRRAAPHVELHLSAAWRGALPSGVVMQALKDIGAALLP